jgi:hypothetical protein
MNLEYQRYGRNKDTVIDSTYINGGEYRKKFDKMSDNPDVSRELYKKAKEMLHHRSGTLFEDMCWIDGETGKLIAEIKDSDVQKAIVYNEKVVEKIKSYNNVIAMHTHPNSYPPSASDLNSFIKCNYTVAFTICHDGKIFKYSAQEEIRQNLYEYYISRFKQDGYSEFSAQLQAIEALKSNSKIICEEVK